MTAAVLPAPVMPPRDAKQELASSGMQAEAPLPSAQERFDEMYSTLSQAKQLLAAFARRLDEWQ